MINPSALYKPRLRCQFPLLLHPLFLAHPLLRFCSLPNPKPSGPELKSKETIEIENFKFEIPPKFKPPLPMRCISNMRSLLSLYLPPTFLSKPSLFAPHAVSPPPLLSIQPIKLTMAGCTGGSSLAVRSLNGGRVDADDRSKDVMGCDGEIHIIIGPMFAGKTTELLRRVKAELSNGRYLLPA
jgi:Thymidine kinase